MRRKNITTLGVVALSALLAGGAQAQVVLSAKAGFGTGGWIAPTANSTLLDTGNLTRGMAYNAATGNVLVLNRSSTMTLNVLDGQTGAFQHTLSNAGISGGGFTSNTVGVTSNGEVYMTNLATTSANFTIYKFADDSANQTSTVYYQGNPAGARSGDATDVYDDGTGVYVGVGTTGLGFNWIANATGNFVAHTNDDFRLGITFAGANNKLFGSEGGILAYFDGTSVGTVGSVLAGSERAMDYIEFNGQKLLAVIDTSTSRVRVFDVSTPLSPLELATGNNTTGTLTSNGNGTGAVAWGVSNTGALSLYAMSTNQGLQAFDVSVVPEPATMTLLALGALAARRRRKNSK